MSGDATLVTSTGVITVGAGTITYAKIQNTSAGSVLLGNPTGSAAAPSEITLGAGLSFSGTTLVGHTGTVTSVSWTGDGTIFTASADTAVTTSGTLTPASLIAQTAHYVLAGPTSAGPTAPTFRALAASDITAGSSGQLLTTVSGASAWATPAVKNFVQSAASNNAVVATSMGNLNPTCSIVLSTAGTYLIFATVRGRIDASSSTAGGSNAQVYMVTQFQDTTNSTTITNSIALITLFQLQITGTSLDFQQTSGIGPFLYTPTSVPATIQLQAYYSKGSSVTVTDAYITTDAAGSTTLTAIQIY